MSRGYNRVAVLRLIGSSGPIARVQIAEQLGLSPATVTAVTRQLLDHGLIRVADRRPSKGGRPALLLELVGGAATAFGVKIAPDHLVGVRVDLDGAVLEQFEEPLDVTAAGAIYEIGNVLERWIGASNSKSRLLGLGIGVPGVVDADQGLVSAPMIGWAELPLARFVQQRLNVPVLVDNDVNTLAVSERLYGRGRHIDDFLTVTLGRGIGLGIIAGGDIYRGYGGGAGEFGHITAKDNGPPCTCGKNGCLEAFVGDPALVAEAQRRGLIPSHAGVDELRKLADTGDASAHEIYGDAAALLGRSVRRSGQRPEPAARVDQRRGNAGLGAHGRSIRTEPALTSLSTAPGRRRRDRPLGRREVGRRSCGARAAADLHRPSRRLGPGQLSQRMGAGRVTRSGGECLTGNRASQVWACDPEDFRRARIVSVPFSSVEVLAS